MAASGDNQELIDKSDELFNAAEFLAMYDLLLPHKESKDANVLWRLARAAAEKGKIMKGATRQTFIYEAFEYIKIALELDDNNFACHQWYGILLDYVGEYEGNKKRIANAYICKEHFIKATELNPKDALTYYCLGYWCFQIATMSWYEKKIAPLLFASPPTSSYDEAMGYFKKAEEVAPGFYNRNIFMIARTYLGLGNKKEAKEYLEKVLGLKAITEDDKEVLRDTEVHLKTL